MKAGLCLRGLMEERESGKKETKDWQTHASVRWTDMERVHLSWCGVGFLDDIILILLWSRGTLMECGTGMNAATSGAIHAEPSRGKDVSA